MGNVLVIDDEKEICLLLTSIMNKLGFDSDFANSMDESREKLKNRKYNIVFLDLNLPDGLGFHLIEDLEAANPEIKIIIISAYDGNVERQRARTEGAHYFIAKPFSKQSILDALSDLKVPFIS